MPLKVLPSITKPPAPSSAEGSRAPRWMLDSQPSRRPLPHSTATAGGVPDPEALHDDTLVAAGEGVLGERVRGSRVVGEEPGHPVLRGNDRVEDLEPFGAAGVEKVTAVRMEDVEEVRRDHDAGI